LHRELAAADARQNYFLLMSESVLAEVGFHFEVLGTVNGTALPL
jgi:hypothetical protein